MNLIDLHHCSFLSIHTLFTIHCNHNKHLIGEITMHAHTVCEYISICMFYCAKQKGLSGKALIRNLRTQIKSILQAASIFGTVNNTVECIMFVKSYTKHICSSAMSRTVPRCSEI